MPANDHLDAALVLTGATGSTTVDFTGATFLEPGIAPHPEEGELWWWGTAYRSVWFRWTAPVDADVVFRIDSGAPSLWDLMIGPDATDWPTFVDNAVYFGSAPLPVGAHFQATAGTTYLIFFNDEGVDNGDGPATAAVLAWGPPPPPAALLLIYDASTNTRIAGVQQEFFLQTDYAPYQTVDWTIDWGDGTAGLHEIDYYFSAVTHTYTTPGTYVITVTVVNGAGLTTTHTHNVLIVALRAQGRPSGAVALDAFEGSMHITDWSGLPAFLDAGVTFTGPTSGNRFDEPFDFSGLAVIVSGAVRLLWFSYVPDRSGTLVIEGRSAPQDQWEPVGVACSDTLYVLNEMITIDYWPATRGHMGVRVEKGKTYLFGLGLDRFTETAYLDVQWSYQKRMITGPCMYVLSGDSYGVSVYAVSLQGETRIVEPAVWRTSPDEYPARPAGTPDGRLYVGRDGDFRLNDSERGLVKATNELLHIPPISAYDTGLYTRGFGLALEWSDQRGQLLVRSDHSMVDMMAPGQKVTTRGDGWTLYGAFTQLRTGDSITLTAPAGMPTKTIHLIAMVRFAIYNVGDVVDDPIPLAFSPGAGLVFTPAYSTSVTVSGGGTATVAFPSTTYAPNWNYVPVNHYMVVDSGLVALAFVEAADVEEGPRNSSFIYGIDEGGTRDYWEVTDRTAPANPWHEGSFEFTEHLVEEWSGQHIRGLSTYWCAELNLVANAVLSGGGYELESDLLREREVVRYELGDGDHVATETLRWTPTYTDHSLEFFQGFRYFTINDAQTRLLVTYDKKNPVDDTATNPLHFNSWYTGGMWIQVYDLTAGPTPVFMHEFRYVPWPSLAGTYHSEPGFGDYQFYAFGVIEFDPTDDNYAFMINNGDAPNAAPFSWELDHQTYIFRIPLYEDYTVQYAAMRTPWCTFNNPDCSENYWFNFGEMDVLPFAVTAGPNRVAFTPYGPTP